MTDPSGTAGEGTGMACGTSPDERGAILDPITNGRPERGSRWIRPLASLGGSLRRLPRSLRRHPFRCLFMVLLLTILGVGGYRGGRYLEAHRRLRAAEQAAERRDFQQALAEMNECLRVWPRRADMQFLAARFARRADLLQEAGRHLSICQELEGVTPANGLEASLLEAQRGHVFDMENALHNLVLQKHPETPLILEALAKGYIQIYRINSASHCLSLLLEQDPNDGQALVLRGRLLVHGNRNAEALNDLRRAVELFPDNDAWRQELAELLVKQNLPVEALPHFEHLRQHRGKNQAVSIGLVQCFNLVGKGPEAGPLLDGLLERYPDNPLVLAERGQFELNAGHPVEAERWLRKAFARDTTNYQIGYKLFTCLNQQGKETEAQELMRKLDHLHADMMRLHQITGEVDMNRPVPGLRYEAGLICLRYGQGNEAIRWFLGALQDDPRHVPTHRALAEYYERIHEQKAAAYHRQRAAEAGGN